ncbi:MAG: tRNA uridine-5-carboxymethylaminomethyl(34) synthesis GTPase MnmE [bacterium]|nr:tRNA uridine-5-carboxymethylaminomethyl(34) synthesis GTPase MnmE [bacterium]
MNRNEDTIVALATPQGRGALAIIRLSGDDAIAIAARLTDAPEQFKAKKPRQIFLTNLIDHDGAILDRVQCIYYLQPHSYTGENAVEIFLHGSPFIVDQAIRNSLRCGARIAEPGEYTLRAFLNGKLDLAQAEAVADLIAASSQAAHRAAIAVHEGALSRRVSAIRKQMVEIRSLLELQIDFSDQELPVIDEEAVKRKIDSIIQELQAMESAYRQGRLARDGASVVISGKPNVGKSTLFNALLKEDRAIVHERPGTTRDTVEGFVEWEGLSIRLIDTAGQDDDYDGPDQLAVARARTVAAVADVVIWVEDATAPKETQNTPAKERAIIVVNKTDLIDNKEIRNNYLSISAQKGFGLPELQKQVIERLGYEKDILFEDGIITRQRHVQAVTRAIDILEGAIERIGIKMREELLAADLKAASDVLGEIMGDVSTDEILDHIFSEFCIGK